MTGKATPEQRARLDKARSMRLGLDGYARILAMLRTPMATREVVAATGVDTITILRTLRSMRQLGLIHRKDWHRPAPHSRLVPYWAIGKHGDVPNPRREEPSKFTPRSILLTLATVIQFIEQEPATLNEIAADMGMHSETASRVIACLRKHKLSRIARWDKPPVGVTVAMHGYCPFAWTPDQRRPARASKIALERKHRATHAAKMAHIAMLQATAGALRVSNEELEAA